MVIRPRTGHRLELDLLELDNSAVRGQRPRTTGKRNVKSKRNSGGSRYKNLATEKCLRTCRRFLQPLGPAERRRRIDFAQAIDVQFAEKDIAHLHGPMMEPPDLESGSRNAALRVLRPKISQSSQIEPAIDPLYHIITLIYVAVTCAARATVSNTE